jgi:hypothetical protein
MSGASTLVAQARVTLIDEDAETWTDDELLGYLVMAVNKACALLLDLYVRVETVALELGVRQYLPEGGLVLIDAPINGAGGPVLQASLTELSRVQRTWPTATPGQPQYFIYDKRSPRTFLVSPPASSGAGLELVFGATPPAFTASDELPISAWFDTALWAFVCGMALAKNTTRQDLTKSAQFMGMFSADLDRWRAIRDATVSPADREGVH